jgi:predicted nucleic acid-binding protein
MTIVDLDRALGDAQRALLDTSAFIAFHTPAEPAYRLARHVLERIGESTDPLRGFYSHLSAAELFIRPIRTSDARFRFMHTFLEEYPNLTGLPLDMIVAVQTATLRATLNLPVVDAAVIATGMLASCEAIVTNDERWKRRGPPLFPQFRWIYLDDYR